MHKLLAMCLGAMLLICTVANAADADAAASPNRLDVVAVAADVQAVVIRDRSGEVHRYAAGDAVTGSHWRVGRIADNQVVLESLQRFHGSALSLRLAPGQHVDLDSMSATLAEMQKPKLLPRSVNAQAAKRRPQRGH
ncbi:MAG TPA: hypothetical protein VFN13_05310 [Rudaea sp.]|nr:hypothetical protein [Rudaea sp.]